MSVAVIINEEDFSRWSMSYPSFVLLLGKLQQQFNRVDLYLPIGCDDELFKQAMKNFNVSEFNTNAIQNGEYTFVLNWYNSIILMEYDFVDVNLFNSINYIVSKRYATHPKFYYCNVAMYMSEDKSFFIKNDIITDYIWSRAII